jgi:hypothetical protein
MLQKIFMLTSTSIMILLFNSYASAMVLYAMLVYLVLNPIRCWQVTLQL